MKKYSSLRHRPKQNSGSCAWIFLKMKVSQISSQLGSLQRYRWTLWKLWEFPLASKKRVDVSSSLILMVARSWFSSWRIIGTAFHLTGFLHQIQNICKGESYFWGVLFMATVNSLFHVLETKRTDVRKRILLATAVPINLNPTQKSKENKETENRL